MDALDRALLQRTLTENAALERSAALLFALAAQMQQAADRDGHGFGLPTLGPGCDDALIQTMLATLQARSVAPQAEAATAAAQDAA